jgi:simple sugar transport system ATP-binding protein
VNTVLDLQGISKHFPGVIANDNIDLTLHQGEIVALLGENGAGKSTLMNIVYGLQQPSEGEIRINGNTVVLHSPGDAIAHGIGMVHQHFQLVPDMTVTENIMLGAESVRNGLLNRKQAALRITELSQRYGLDVDPGAIIEDLSVGERQRVEIVKTLYRDAEILILDEPTAVLTPQEVNGLFSIMQRLRELGKSMIFITHKLKEVLYIADRISVLRNGRVAGHATPATSSETELATLMVGREVNLTFEPADNSTGELILDARDLCARDDTGHLAVRNVNLQVSAGEIVGIAGVQGNGQSELVEVLTGLRRSTSGTVSIDNTNLTNQPPRAFTEIGRICHIPEDRHLHGMVADYSVADNLALNSYRNEPFSNNGVINRSAIRAQAETLVQAFDVRTPTIETTAGSLSGGNQQKMVVAREFSRESRLLIAAQPTRGIDVGSIEFIHRRIVAKRDEGVAVLLISAELDEILSLSDRIIVMYQGSVVAEVNRRDATREQLGLYMAGAQQSGNAAQ